MEDSVTYLALAVVVYALDCYWYERLIRRWVREAGDSIVTRIDSHRRAA